MTGEFMTGEFDGAAAAGDRVVRLHAHTAPAGKATAGSNDLHRVRTLHQTAGNREDLVGPDQIKRLKAIKRNENNTARRTHAAMIPGKDHGRNDNDRTNPAIATATCDLR